MRLVLQRVTRASVTIDSKVVGQIADGLLVLAGFAADDTPEVMRAMAQKTMELRIFEDEDGRMNLSAASRQLPVLLVSQFTLYADCRRGRRPGFTNAAPPQEAQRLYEQFVAIMREVAADVHTGEFGADMQVELVNRGPVTIILDSAELFPKL